MPGTPNDISIAVADFPLMLLAGFLSFAMIWLAARLLNRHRLSRLVHRSRIWSAFPILLLVAACGEEPEPPEIVRPVRAIQVQEAGALKERWFPGRAQATQEVNLAFEVPGQLIERPVNVGSIVEQGQLLARLDPRDYKNTLDEKTALRDRSRANYERMQEAVKSGAVSKQDVDDARAVFEGSDAQVRIAQKQLEDTTIRAEFPGTVAATYVENFQNVLAKQAILRLLDTTRVEMWINVPESLISYAPYVEDFRVKFDAFPDHEIRGEIIEISNEASFATRTYPVKIVMEQPDDVTILPGMAGRASANRIDLVEDDAGTGFEIPMSALATKDNKSTHVWVIDEASGTVSSRPIEIGHASPRGVVVDGVEPGEWIATAGVHSLKEGQKVRVVDAAEMRIEAVQTFGDSEAPEGGEDGDAPETGEGGDS